jgi:cell division protein FtsZ
MLDIIDDRTSPALLKVLGVGGGGSNAVNRMVQAGLLGVDFWVANTDLQALENASCVNRLSLGRAVTRGLGAGGDPEVGRLAAEEDRAAIAEILRGTDMLFLTAGMGGGTGTGGAPVVAEVARELGILTVAIVTKPFAFEGKKKMARATAGLELLARHVDTLIAIPNQKLLNIVQPGTPFKAAMLVADEVLFQATRGISDLITGHGLINLDFADVKSVMRDRGNALLGCGVGSGKNRAIEAAQAAVSSPLLEEMPIHGAEAVLINVQGGPDMGLHEAAEATQFISERVGEDAEVFWGAVIDPTLDEEMRVTIIATGFARAGQVPVPARAGSVTVNVPMSLPVVSEPSRALPVVEATPTPAPLPTPAVPAAPLPAPAAPEAPRPLPVLEPEPAYAGAVDDLDLDLDALTRPSRDGWERDHETEIFLPPERPAPARAGVGRAEAGRPAWPEPASIARGSSDQRPRGLGPVGGPVGGPVVGPAGGHAGRDLERERESDRVIPFPGRRESGLEPRLGKHHPLDRPAFMRKKMD